MIVFGKYQLKIRQNKITDGELDELEDELIYSQVWFYKRIWMYLVIL